MDDLSSDKGGLPDTALIERPAPVAVRVSGADRASFLQGLLTNDVVAVGAGHGCYAAYLTPQGRMIADVTVLVGADAILLLAPPKLDPSLAPRFDALVFSEDVQITEMDGMQTRVSVAGPSSAAVVTRALSAMNAAPAEPGPLSGWAEYDHATLPLQGTSGPGLLVVASHHYAESGFDLIAAEGDAPALRAALYDAGAVPIDAGAAEVARIERGRPEFGVDMDHETIPLEAGLEARAISLTKGCYVGQEVIIRVLHRGQGRVARRLVVLVLDAGAAAAPGDPIVGSDRSIGQVTSAAWSPARGRFVALGYVHRDYSASGTEVTVRHGDAAGRAVVRALGQDQKD